jgi:hypothetical protein
VILVDWTFRERHRIFRYGGTIRDAVTEAGPFAPGIGFAER